LTGAGSAANCPLAGCNHGSHVASIAVGNSGVLDGVARDARLIAIKIASRDATCAPKPSPCIALQRTDQISALQRVFALRNTFKIAAVNMSFGGGLSAVGCDAAAGNAPYAAIMNSILAAGIAPVKSSGNNGSNTSVTFPGCLSAAIVVGNSTDTDRAASTSNISPLVDLMAPGSKIRSAEPGKT
jgi:hypothetical protein